MDKLHLARALTPEGWREDVTLSIGADGRIAAVETGAPPAGAPRIAGAVLPGLPNLHSHAFQRGMAGLTTVGEFHYLHNDKDGRPYADPAELGRRCLAAAAAAGIGITLLPVFYAHSGFGGLPPGEGQRRFITDPAGFARLVAASREAAAGQARAAVGIAPHSLRAVTTAELRDLVAAHPTGPVHIHVCEQVKEVEDCLAAHGRRPIQLLAETVALDERWCLIHATHADAGERRLTAEAGAVVGLCPITEANLGDGLFEGTDFVGQGGRFGIGTDSNVAISGAGELAMLEYAQRLGSRRRNALAPRGASTGRTLFEACLAGGAQALGLGPAGIRVGAPADLVVLDTNGIAFAAREGDALLDAWIFGPSAGAIREVYVSGRRIVEGGRHVARSAVEARARKVLERVIRSQA